MSYFITLTLFGLVAEWIILEEHCFNILKHTRTLQARLKSNVEELESISLSCSRCCESQPGSEDPTNISCIWIYLALTLRFKVKKILVKKILALGFFVVKKILALGFFLSLRLGDKRHNVMIFLNDYL